MNQDQSQPRQLRFAMQWALESASDPASAAADWLARDICPTAVSAVSLLTSPDASLEHIRQAKDVYKTMRVLGETKSDRRTGGRLYLAAIAAGLVLHGKRISRQADTTLRRALDEMVMDDRVDFALRKLASQAIIVLEGGKVSDDSQTAMRSLNGTHAHEDDQDDAMDDTLPLEIERTYLLDRLPNLPPEAEAIRIEQGYLPDDAALKGRLRREVHSDGTTRYTHTIKKGSGLVRQEEERVISDAEFARHWPTTNGHRLTKTRYVVRSNGFAWEIDVFDRLNLVLAEVELPTAATVAPPPLWLKPHIVREVTHEKQYRNHQLALRLAKEQAAG